MYSRYCTCCQELCACSIYFEVIIILFLGNGISLCWDRFGSPIVQVLQIGVS